MKSLWIKSEYNDWPTGISGFRPEESPQQDWQVLFDHCADRGDEIFLQGVDQSGLELIALASELGLGANQREEPQFEFRGTVRDDWSDWIRQHSFDDEGNVKWQLLALYGKGLLLFYSVHYGAEMHVFGVSEEDEITLRKAVRGDLRKSPLRRVPMARCSSFIALVCGLNVHRSPRDWSSGAKLADRFLEPIAPSPRIGPGLCVVTEKCFTVSRGIRGLKRAERP